jgi:hypothetical protein
MTSNFSGHRVCGKVGMQLLRWREPSRLRRVAKAQESIAQLWAVGFADKGQVSPTRLNQALAR